MISRLFSIVLVAALAVVPVSSYAAVAIDRSGGMTIISQPDGAASLIGVELVVRAGLDRQSLSQSGLAALTAETILRAPVGATPPCGQVGAGTPLEDAIDALGGSIRVTIDPDGARFYVESLAAQAPAVLALLGQALAAPQIVPSAVNDARGVLNKSIADSQDIPLQVGIEMLDRADPIAANAALPPLGSGASLAQLLPDDVRAFYQQFYRRGGVTISAVGHLDRLPADALNALANALPVGATQPVAVHIPELKGTSHELVAHRDISAPWLIAQYRAPSIDSKDFGPMLVLSAFVQRTLANIVQVPGIVSTTFVSRSVGANFNFDRNPTALVIYVNGNIGDPQRTFAMVLSIVNVLAATRLSGSIDTFKAMAYGDFTTGAVTLESRARLAAVFARNGASPDYVNRAMQAIDGTTADDLQRVAKTYLGNPTIALVLPRGQGN